MSRNFRFFKFGLRVITENMIEISKNSSNKMGRLPSPSNVTDLRGNHYTCKSDSILPEEKCSHGKKTKNTYI